MDFQEITEDNGFIYESYEVVTQDGYILSLFHIIDPDNQPYE